MPLRRLLSLALICSAALAAEKRSLIVISVDGLDHRYLRDRDRLGLKIPVLRKLIREGTLVDGVTGVVPTVTWPSHTTLITGARPAQHGILGNRRPASEGGDYYWSASLLKVPTLWHKARQAGLKSAAITWPVTVDATIDYNLPEAFVKRNGGGMDLATIAARGTPGLADEIAKSDPSFQQEFMDDRTRTLATVFILKRYRPALMLLHLVDHDAAAHEHGPFSSQANAEIERSDGFIGQIIKAAPKGAVVAVVSDHGFERIDRRITAEDLGAKGATLAGGLAVASTPEAAAALRASMKDARNGVLREVSRTELQQFGVTGLAAFETVEHTAWTRPGAAGGERGDHGLWPLRNDYRSSYLLWGEGVPAAKVPEVDMLELAHRFASILGLKLDRLN